MKLMQTLRRAGRRFSQTWRQQNKANLTASQAFLRGAEESAASTAALLSPYQQSSWIYAAVSAKAAKFSQVPLRLSRTAAGKPGENVILSGPLFDLLQRPHPQLDRFTFWELISTWLDLRGEVFLLALDNAGRVVSTRPTAGGGFPVQQLIVLSPDGMREVIEDRALAGWRYQADGPNAPFETTAFLPEEVIHIRLPNPFNFWRGMSPLSVAVLAAQTDYAAAQFMKGFILNNADLGLIVTSEEKFTPQQREEILAILRERKRQAGAADRPLFLSHKIQVHKPQLSAADLQFLENRKFSRQEICSIFKVPQTILGFTEDANRSVDEQQSTNWIHNVIAPLCRRIEAGLQPLTALAGPGVTAWFDSDTLPEMQAARRSRVDTAVKLFGLGVPLNDLNRELDLGFPEYPWGKTGYLPQNIKPAEEVR